jgi:hypothetical protein
MHLVLFLSENPLSGTGQNHAAGINNLQGDHPDQF